MWPRDTTIWLDPAAPAPATADSGTVASAAGSEAWARLRRVLQKRFPRCLGRPEGFTPHLTLGRTNLPGVSGIRLDPMIARVGAIVLLSRRAGEPIRPRAVIALGTGDLRWLPDPTTPNPDATTPASGPAPGDLADRIVARLTAALCPGVVQVAGSRRMGCALPAADIDLVAVLPNTEGRRACRGRSRAAMARA
ncbi:2'-5' RNA ligase family protein [Nonomuraea sp. NPDC005692]|uniref:2'-5' RNA ligase family protein n=1 Tax=Nonomuraea sp. NPDC005692 TaxID=3157168 RepID=UPI0033E714E0